MDRGDIDTRVKLTKDRDSVEQREDWRGMCALIPAINFPSNWHVKMQMPFTFAAARFLASPNTTGEPFVSVYFDPFDKLGYFGRPYWEVYPNENGGNVRFAAGDEDEMVKEINRIFKAHERDSKKASGRNNK